MKRGYIALTSILVISFLVMALIFAVSLSGFFLRENILDAYAKTVSLETAEACAYLALLRRAENQDYQGNEVVTVGAETCSISQIQTVGSELQINISATSLGAATKIFVSVDSTSLSLISWKETI